MGQPEIGDLERIKEARTKERLAAMAEAEHVKAVSIWPTPCARCFALAGERCLTRTGKRAMRHKGRD